MSRIDFRRVAGTRWLVFLLTTIVHGFLAAHGRHLSADSSTYIRLADGFRAANFGETFNLDGMRWTKMFYISVLAAARAISSDHWIAIMLAVNVICSAFIAVLLVDLVLRVSRSAVVPLFALVAYLGSYELFQWVAFVLTDLLYAVTAFAVFYLVARRLIDAEHSPRPIWLVLAVFFAITSRPTGLLLIPLVIVVELVFVSKRVRARTAAVIVLALLAVALAVRTTVMHDPAKWPFRFIRPRIDEYAAREKTGEVIYDRHETYRKPPTTAGDHLVITADRTVRFFQVTSSGYSRMHNIINLLYFVPVYLLGIVAVILDWRAGGRRRDLLIANLLWITGFAVFYGLTLMDFDFRYRAPLMPQFVLLAACGLEALLISRSAGG